MFGQKAIGKYHRRSQTSALFKIDEDVRILHRSTDHKTREKENHCLEKHFQEGKSRVCVMCFRSNGQSDSELGRLIVAAHW